MSIQTLQTTTPSSKLTTAWWRAFRDAPASVDLLLLNDLDKTAELRAAAALLAPSPYPGVPSAKKFGRWLARAAGEPRLLFDQDSKPYRLERLTTAHARAAWRLVPDARTKEVEGAAA